MQAGRRREVYAGGVVAAIGLAAVVKGSGYALGTSTDMGPGLFPVMIGGALMIVGTLIAAVSPSSGEAQAYPRFDPRVWLCVLAGAVLFIVFAQTAGLLPAIFFSVLTTAWADRTATWRGTVALACGVTAFGLALFTYALHVPIPIIGGF